MAGTRGHAQVILHVIRTAAIGLLFDAIVAASSDVHIFPVTLTNASAEASSCTFPSTLRVEIKSSKSFPEFLVLHRKDVVNTDPPAYVIRTRANGDVYLHQIDSGPSRKVSAAYQNTEDGAAFLATCTARGLDISGTFYVDGLKYRARRLGSKGIQTSAREARVYYEFVPVKDTPHHDGQSSRAYSRSRRESDLYRGPFVRDTASSSDSRAKRSGKTEYFIDVLVALDFAFYQYWLKQANGDSANAIRFAKDYIAYLFNGINSRFSSVETDTIKLHVVLSSFLILQKADQSPWTEEVKQQAGEVTQVQAEAVLSKLETYVKDSYNDLPPHDHFMLITEYDLYSHDNGFRFNSTSGFAYIGTICYKDGRSVSVIEDHGGYQSEATATHELGHSMGAKHDGDQNPCSSSDRYVMAGGIHPETAATKRNPWIFSSCSVASIAAQFQSLISDGLESCLLTKVAQTGVPSVDGFPGQKAGPDEQCRQIYGPRSYLCRGTSFGSADDVCLSMYCHNPATRSACTLNTAAPGTCCGNGKPLERPECRRSQFPPPVEGFLSQWCLDGQCTASPSAECYMSETCPFGQRQGAVLGNFTCDDMEAGHCYFDNFRKVCCKMCDKSYTGNVGCEYGDKVKGCVAASCGLYLASGDRYDIQCCGTCNFVPPPCRDATQVNDKETCPMYLDRLGSAECCKPKFREDCCESCQARKSDDPSCPYGDCRNCSHLENNTEPCSAVQRSGCCRTCNDLDKAMAPPTTTTTTTTTTTSTAPTATTVATTTDAVINTIPKATSPTATSNTTASADRPGRKCKYGGVGDITTCSGMRARQDFLMAAWLISTSVLAFVAW